ncbi:MULTISPECIES: hypothetical protein [unclassified Streptomyces]|uniref:hypothetical protein n=1 Tax=unclassified Streptomyces TaxID=2593676 RepID=UPI000939EF8D|nr:hypothetical protein [Streptomyces sp. CB02058]OKI88725.1 hypothetical protein AMK10_30870 [Streptomyces sp. CB02058]
MPETIRMSHRAWVATSALLCGAGLAATAGLNASSSPDPNPEEPVSAECAERIADIETELAKAKDEGNDTVLTFSRVQVGDRNDCSDELRHHFHGDQ